MRVRYASLSFAAGHRVSYYSVRLYSARNLEISRSPANSTRSFPPLAVRTSRRRADLSWNVPLLLLLLPVPAKVRCVKFNVTEHKQERGVSPFLADWISRVRALICARSREYKARLYVRSHSPTIPKWHAGSVRSIQIYSGIIYDRAWYTGCHRFFSAEQHVSAACVRSPLSNLSLSRDGFALRFAVAEPGWI